jgi:DNA invertase Pin-like site-specific DNA recombinase
MLAVLGGLGEFERTLIHTRTGEGRERAKARGVKMGPKFKLTPHQMREAIRRRENGDETLEDIGHSTTSSQHDFKASGMSAITLQRTDPVKNMRRFYRLNEQRDRRGAVRCWKFKVRRRKFTDGYAGRPFC